MTDLKTDIVFVNPQGYGTSGFPFGIAILAAVLRKRGYRVAIVDASSENLDVPGVVEKVLEINPKIAGITGILHYSSFNKELSRMLSSKMPSLIQIAGGYWANTAAEYVLENTAIDYVVLGEADLIITDIVKALLDKTPVDEIPGLAYLNKNTGVYVEHPNTQLPHNMDTLPMPAYDLFKNPDYYILTLKPEEYPFYVYWKALKEFKEKNGNKTLKLISMYSGRGCYGKCDFCAAATLLRRNHSPSYVVSHMELLSERYGANVFNFTESLTLSTKNWVRDFCKEIIDRRLDVYYIVISRADFNYDEEVLNILAQSGCINVGIGFESANDNMLRGMNKKVSVKNYYKVIEDFTNKNIKINSSFILNMPGETFESMDDTLNFIKKTRLTAGFGFAYPYPGTRLYEFAKDNYFCTISDLMFTKASKRLDSKKDFQEYISKYNYNNLDPKKLYSINKQFKKQEFYNMVYNNTHSDLLRRALDVFPASINLIRFCSYGIKFFHSAIRGLITRFIRMSKKKG